MEMTLNWEMGSDEKAFSNGFATSFVFGVAWRLKAIAVDTHLLIPLGLLGTMSYSELRAKTLEDAGTIPCC